MKRFAPVRATLLVAGLAYFAAGGPPCSQAELVGHWTFDNGSLLDLTGNFDALVLEGDAELVDGALDINGVGTNATGWAHAPALPASAPLENKTLVSWITLESLSDGAMSGAAIAIDVQVGDRFDGIVFAERNANRWMNGSSNFHRTPAEQFDQTASSEETTVPSPSIIKLAISYEGLGGDQVRITGYRNGEIMGTYEIGSFATWAAGEYEVLFGPRHTSPAPNGALDARIHEARLYDTALTQAEIQALQLSSNTDTDNDDLPDQWEMQTAGNLTDLNGKGAGPGPGAGTGDFDGDGLLDKNELPANTDPKLADTDGDTLTDGAEVAGAGARPPTSPRRADTDNDELSDAVETNDGSFNGLNDTGTNPTLADTDEDGFDDGLEVTELSSNPLSAAEPTLAQTLFGHWTFEAGSELKDLTGRFPDVELEGDAEIKNGALNINGTGTTATGWAHTGVGGSAISSKTLVAWTTLEGLEDIAKSGAPMALDSALSDKFDGIVFAERNANRWMNGSSNFHRSPPEQFDQIAISEETTTGSQIMLAITYKDLGDGQVQLTGYRNGQSMGQYDTPSFATWAEGEQEVLFGPRHTSPATNGALDALVHEARLYGKAATPEEIQALFTAGPVLGTDQDSDGLADAWEIQNAGNLTDLNGKGAGPGPGAGTGDFDGDGLLELSEQTRGTNPKMADTDGDTLADGAEVAGAGQRPPTSPTKADSDSDGLSDLVETNDGSFNGPTDTGTNPTMADTDGDGLSDGDEVNRLSSNPLDPASPGLEGSLFGHWTFEAGSELKDLTGNFPDIILEGTATIENGALDINGEGTTATGWARTDAGGLAIGSKTLVSWITLQGLEDIAKSGAPIALDSTVIDRFDGIVFAERNFNRWMSGSSNFHRSPPEQFDIVEVSEEVEVTPEGTQIMLAITYDDLGAGQVEITGYRNGVVMGTYTSGSFATWPAGQQEVLFGPRHTSPATNGALDALVHEARLYGKAATAQEILALFNAGPVGSQPLVITAIVVNLPAGTVDVTWTSKVGKTYRPEYSDDLRTWFEDDDNYPPGGATSASTTYRFSGIPASATARYFRVTEE
ncbi:MAG: hypothetical protein ACKV19_04580 [Verrucomicrobiales bacterium]